MEEVRLLHLQLPTYRHFHLLIYDEEHKNQHFEISLSYLHQFKKEGNKQVPEYIGRAGGT